MQRIVGISLLVIFFAATSRAEVYNADAVTITPGLDMTFKSMEMESGPVDVHLIRHTNPLDPEGLYWKLGDVVPAFQMKTVYKKTFAYSNEEPGERHQLDIYYTDQSASNKVVMFVPGGAWRQGDKNSYETLGNALAGYHDLTVVVINYRLSNDTGGGSARHPDHIEDVAEAFAWVKKNIFPYGDGRKVYLFGQSAGAHLVALMATDGSYLNAVGYGLSDIEGVVAMSGAYYLPDLVTYPQNPLGLGVEETLMFKKITLDAFGGWGDVFLMPPSPQVHITADQPSMLVIATYNDLPGFKESAEKFVSAVRALDPAPEISLRTLEFFDYTEEVWETATTQASQEPAMADFVGHWAEVIAINPNEPDGYIPGLVVEFLQTH